MNKYVRKLFGVVFHSQSKQTQQSVLGQPLSLPTSPEEWHAHWQTKGFLWRVEPEIPLERQRELSKCRTVVPNIEKGIYPFKAMKLSRADIEWLLATHENGRGPVDWNDEGQREREGLDLRGADVSQVDLNSLPLARLNGGILLDDWDFTAEQLASAALLMRQTNLREAHLEGANLVGAYLEGSSLSKTHLEEAELTRIHLEGGDLSETYLAEADFFGAYLAGADFSYADLDVATFQEAHLEKVDFSSVHLSRNTHICETHLEDACFRGAHLEECCFQQAHLERADLTNTYLERAEFIEAYLENVDLRYAHLEDVLLNNVTMANQKHIGPRLLDVYWGSTNLTVVDWSQINMLGDEYIAIQKKYTLGVGHSSQLGNLKDKDTRLEEHKEAVRANRQLAVILQSQGINADAARFAYRAQVLQRKALWFQVLQPNLPFKQRLRPSGAWLFSWFLFLLAGYGYKPGRSFLAYVFVISIFAILYLWLSPQLVWYEAVVVSMTAFHGRGFSPSTFSPGDPLSIASAFEAFVGLIIEATFIATLTQRFFSK